MTKLVNRAKMTTATTGTGSPITLGSAVDGYQSFAAAGVADADVVRYVIEDGDAWEIGLGTYTASGTTLTRGSIESSNSDLAINLSGNAVVYVSAAAADLQELVDFAGNFVLPTADGSTGQVLTTNGAGTLSFTTISGYTDADVDTHLNTSTASSGEVLSWTGSDYDWVAVSGGATDINGLSDGYSDGSSVGLGSGALANDDGTTNSNTAIGLNAGSIITSGNTNVLVGRSANLNSATGTEAVVVGTYAKAGGSSVTIGSTAGGGIGTSSDQNVFIGAYSGRYTNNSSSIALGLRALYGNIASLMTGDNNVGIGYETGYDITTGSHNFLAGRLAGTNLTTGSNNVALGNGALDAATTGGRNIAIGQDAMGLGVATAASGDNVTIGYQAGYDLTSGTGNVFIGKSAGSNYTTVSGNVSIGNGSTVNWTGGSSNTVIGSLAAGLGANSTGEANTIMGAAAGYDLANGSENTFVGQASGYNVTSGGQNVHVGRLAGNTTTTGSNQIVLGYDAEASSATVSNEITLGNSSITRFRIPGIQSGATNGDVLTYDSTNGILSLQAPAGGGATDIDGLTDAQSFSNTSYGLGYKALSTNNTGTNNLAFGSEVLKGGSFNSTVSGSYNFATGRYSGENISTGSGNILLGGFGVGQNVTSGAYNVFAGHGVGNDVTTGSNNVALGNGALDAATTGSDQIAIGQNAMGLGVNVASGTNAQNIAIGTQALEDITSGIANIAIGKEALKDLTTAITNVAIGRTALAGTVGNGNVAIGDRSGSEINGGANNTFIGTDSGWGTGLYQPSGSNNSCFGYQAQGSTDAVSNEITLGNSSIATLRCQVTTITSLSDARDKTDIQPLNAGLDFVNALEPVSFTWNMRDGGKVGEADTGFIAQDLQKAQADTGVSIPGLVYDVNPDKLEAGYGKLVPVLVQAIKDLSAKVDELEARLEGK